MISNFAYILRENKKPLFIVMLISGVTALLFSAVDPIVLKLLIDEGLAKKELGLFVTLVGAVVCLGTVIRIGNYAISILTLKIQNEAVRKLTGRMLDVYYNIPYGEILKHEKGYYLSRIYDEPRKASESTFSLLIHTFSDVLTLIAAIGVSLYLTWKTTTLLILIVPALYYLSKKFGSKIRKQSMLENEQEANTREAVTKSLEAYKTVRLFSLLDTTKRYVSEALGLSLEALLKRVRTSAFLQTTSSIFLSLAESSVLVLAAIDVFTGTLTIGGMMGYMSAFWRMITAVNNLISKVPDFSKVSGYIDRLRELEALGEPRNNSPEPDSEISIENGSFRYNGKYVFGDFSMRVEKGERILLLGPNGSGKTTLANLVSGFLKTEQGVLRTPDQSRVSALIEPFTFVPGTLRDNLNLDGSLNGRGEQAETLLKRFRLLEKLDEVPSTFSMGQKKKAYIIMTLLKEADVYIFDEPLSGVDVESKAAVVESILTSTEGKTLLVIAHSENGFDGITHRKILLSSVVDSTELEPQEA